MPTLTTVVNFDSVTFTAVSYTVTASFTYSDGLNTREVTFTATDPDLATANQDVADQMKNVSQPASGLVAALEA